MENFYDRWANRVYVQWHITNVCNNRCIHCYQGSYKGVNTTIAEAKPIITDLIECCEAFEALPVVALTGGNPMSNKDFWEIASEYRRQSEFGCLSILGNPENLDLPTIERLKPYGLHHFQVSLDGLEETHDKVRYPGSFKRTIKAINDMSKNGIPVYVMSTVWDKNYKEIKEVMKIAYANGTKHWMFARVVPKQGDCGISANEYIKFIWDIMEEHEKYEKKGYKQLKKEPMISRYRNEKSHNELEVVSGGCGMGSSTITLLPDQTLMACRRHPDSVIGKWTHDDNFLYHFLDNPEMEKYRQIDKIKGCKDCTLLKHCRGCRAVAYVATGADNNADPQCNKERR